MKGPDKEKINRRTKRWITDIEIVILFIYLFYFTDMKYLFGWTSDSDINTLNKEDKDLIKRDETPIHINKEQVTFMKQEHYQFIQMQLES